MKTIEINKNLLDQRPIYQGFESKIYKKDDILYKIFDDSVCDNNVIKNKILKLELIKELNINITKPINIVKNKDKIVGYTMKHYEEYKHLNSFDKNKKKKIETLKKVKEELEKLHDNNIIYGDLRLANILEHDGSIMFCDIDNININNYNFDATCYAQNRYIQKFGIDKNIDNYMLNVITISYLKRVMELYCIGYIKNNSLPFIINNKENREIAENMVKMKQKQINLFIDNTKRYHL